MVSRTGSQTGWCEEQNRNAGQVGSKSSIGLADRRQAERQLQKSHRISKAMPFMARYLLSCLSQITSAVLSMTKVW